MRTGLLCLLVFTHLFLANIVRADPGTSVEYTIKAAFLYKFGLYVTWPSGAFKSADSPIEVGVLGTREVFAQVEAAMQGRLLAGRSITVSRVNDQNLSRFHLLFFTGSEQSRPDRQEIPDDLPVLLVTESSDWPGLGVINFVLENERVRFDVDLESAQKRGLDLSAQLLNVARSVRGKP